MAKADIQLAVKGLRELRSLNIHLDKNSTAIDKSLEKIMKYNSVTRSHFVPTLNNLSSALAKAQANFDKANISTVQGIKAAENLANAQAKVNAELLERNNLLKTVGPRGQAFGPQQATSTQKEITQTQQASDQEQLNQALLKLENRSLDNISKKVELRNKEVAQGKKLVSEAGNRRKILANNNKLRFEEFKTAGKIQEREIRIGKILEKNAKFRNSFRGRTQRAIAGGSKENLDIRNQAISNALIGGAFPLLFGQGAGASAGGALGGAVGGLLGGQFGFALSLVGTQIGSAIDSLINGAAELGKALGPFTQDVGAVTTALGLQGSVQEARINKIEELKGKTAAFIAAQKIMSAEIGQRGVDALKKFGESSRILGSQFALALTKLQALTAGLFNFINTITGINRALEQADANRIVKAEAALGDEEAQDLQNRQDAINKKTRGSESFFGPSTTIEESLQLSVDQKKLDIEKKLFAIRKQISVETSKLTSKSGDLLLKKQQEFELNERTAEIMKRGINKELAESLAKIELQFEKEEELLKQKLKQAEAEFKKLENDEASDQVLDKVLEKEIQIGVEIDKHNERKEETLNLTEKLFTETDKVAEAFKDLSVTIGEDIKNGIKGLIKGTSTLSDLLNNVADKFLDVALNQALFGDILGSKGDKGGGILGALGLFADGGRPPVNRPSIVGEKGPELFVPRSSGNIIPNNKLGGGNTNNVVVNVDASGSDVQGDEAAAKEIGTLISVAVQGELLKQQRPGGLLSR